MTHHELFLLHFGRLGEESSTGETHFSQVPGYLIRSASGRLILVDTGNPASMTGKPTAEPWMLLLNDTKPEDDVIARLAELGHKVEDIDLIVSTHFDFDHCGRHDAFAGAGTEVLVQKSHMEAATVSPERYFPELWNHPGLRFTLFEGDTELEPGLVLLETSGHATGHQSLFVETASGPVILAADAISSSELITTRVAPDWYSDREEAIRSMDRLIALSEETGAYLLLGHESSQWETLPKSPAPFSRPA